MTDAAAVETVAVADDLFRMTDDGPALVGTRCTSCGTHYFPRSLSCRNPSCEVKAVAEVLLGHRGRLYSYTVQAYRPPALFAVQDWQPYAIGLVELPEGLRVLSRLTGCSLDEVRIDMPLVLVLEPLSRNAAGRDVVTYAYAPAAA